MPVPSVAGGGVGEVANRLTAVQRLTGLVGQSPGFVNSICMLPELARGEATVLLNGETGTGKELVARAIHYLGPRAAFPFVPVNCGALPDTLLEAELFGHERGAFTDARARRVGLVEEADRGTLFLDEVDSLSPRGQIALLRLLQEKRFRPLGGGRERSVDVRFVAASNQPLEELVEERTFRADLFYRLAVLTLTLPPLRDRPEDILPLARHLLRRNLPSDRKEPGFSAAAVTAMVLSPWPGNVRQLENAVLRALHLAGPSVIEPEHLGISQTSPPATAEASENGAGGRNEPADSLLDSAGRAEVSAGGPHLTFQEAKQRIIDAFEREYLSRALAEHGGNVSHAARSAGKERREFGRLLKKHHIDPRAFGPPR